MSTIMNRIRRAFEKHLEATAGVTRIFWENTNNENLIGASHVEPNFIPLTKRPVTAGPNPLERYTGLYQILVYTPLHEGSGPSDALVDLLLSRFRPAEHLEDTVGSDTVIVRLEYSETGESYEDRGCHVTPVTIGWNSYRGT